MIKILGVKIDNTTKYQAMQKIASFLKSEKQHYIVTPNPEFLVAANKDKEFKKVLNKADLSLPDGVGLVFASLFKIKERITGTDLIEDICKHAEKHCYTIYLLGGEKDIAHLSSCKLQKKCKRLKIAGYQDGMTSESTNLDHINVAQPDILFVAFGHIKQEKWIKENLHSLPSVKIAIGIGGAFDYISGRVNRAPVIMRGLGLEWMYRLAKQPKRAKRIYDAVIKFPILVIIDKIKQ
ncbi:WecB/TagA/CpsF family glycosyltransferase [Patescibacteria group bacterium]|nr:WecB/TagA/CpsF family glycosyltransferase [Patescibacteria group bacterium]